MCCIFYFPDEYEDKYATKKQTTGVSEVFIYRIRRFPEPASWSQTLLRMETPEELI